MTEFVFRSSLGPAYREAVERLVFFNPRQREAETGITDVIELYGTPAIVSDEAGLRVVVSRRHDVQCLFALAPKASSLTLAGMIVFLRTSVDEILVLHVAVAARFSRTRKSGLQVVMALVGAVREIAHRLRGVQHVRVLYLGRDKSSPAIQPAAGCVQSPSAG